MERVVRAIDWWSPLLFVLGIVYLATPYVAFAGLISGNPLLAGAEASELSRLRGLHYLLYAAMCAASGLLGLGLSVLLRHRQGTWFFGGTTLFFALALLFYLLL